MFYDSKEGILSFSVNGEDIGQKITDNKLKEGIFYVGISLEA